MDYKDFLQLLGRAARQFHTYPPTSPMCTDAVDACQRAYAALDSGPLVFRVASRELIVDEIRIGGGGIIEQDLARPLHRARVASVEIKPTASVRDWAQFCTALMGCHRAAKTKINFAELLLEAGVAAIVVRMVPRPEVVELGAPAPSLCNLVERERARQAGRAGGAVQYFYPPDKGWIRLDPSVQYESISLLDLAVVVNDPMELAGILMRLTDDEGEAGARHGAALEQKYGDVVTVISALDPRLARQLFAKLARAVLELDSPGRQRLLRRSILPGLLDGSAHSEAVLSEFPDIDLADAVCLLLDFETAAPELLADAVDRLNLPSERRNALVPLIHERLRSGPPDSTNERRSDADLSRYASALIRVDSASRRSFAAFAAFDLSMNDETTAALADLRDAIAATAAADARLACLSSLTRLEPNPLAVGTFVQRALEMLRDLARGGRSDRLLHWLTRFSDIATTLQASRPDAAEAVRYVLAQFCNRDLILQLADLAGRGEDDRGHVKRVVAALGRSMVPAWLEVLESSADRARLNPLAPLLAAHARELAPAVARSLPGCSLEALRAAVELLGSAGPGAEAAIGSQLPRMDQRTGRDALRALARIGTPKAAAVVVDQLESGRTWASAAAEEALWRLPAALALTTACDLLGRRSFVVRHPECASRLFARVAQTNNGVAVPLAERLVSLRYHFWNPAVARLGMKARDLRR